MKVISLEGRSIVVYKGHPFYRSTGTCTDPSMRAKWYPFLGYRPHNLIKCWGHSSGFIQDATLRVHAEELNAMDIPIGEPVDTPDRIEGGLKVNEFLESQGWSVKDQTFRA